MLHFDNNPNYIYYASSILGEKLLALITLSPPSRQDADYNIDIKLNNATLLSSEEKQTIANDIIDFITNSQNYIKADS